MFAATLWAALTCAAWTTVLSASDDGQTVLFRVGVRVCMFLGPCIAVGALFGRAALGAGIGLAVELAGALLLWALNGFSAGF